MPTKFDLLVTNRMYCYPDYIARLERLDLRGDGWIFNQTQTETTKVLDLKSSPRELGADVGHRAQVTCKKLMRRQSHKQGGSKDKAPRPPGGWELWKFDITLTNQKCLTVFWCERGDALLTHLIPLDKELTKIELDTKLSSQTVPSPRLVESLRSFGIQI